jgi:C-terminal processing protease CtpA/Prc
VIVLQGPHCVSSNEAFVQMMAALPTVTTMGANTRGASGNPAPFDLMPDVRVAIPRWQTLTLDGTLLEGRGSDPEVRAEFPAGAFKDADPLLSAAVERLRK